MARSLVQFVSAECSSSDVTVELGIDSLTLGDTFTVHNPVNARKKEEKKKMSTLLVELLT